MSNSIGMRHGLAVAALLLAPALAFGSGFALFEHGARGVALGGAFAATADDATAGYYNPAGLAFQEGTKSAAGVYFITFDSKFQGDNPYPGVGYESQQESQIFFPVHGYASGEISDRLRWGFAMTAPFGLGTWWPDDFAGKFITKRIDLKVFNLNPNLAFKVNDNLALAVGFDYFLSAVDLTKSVGVINPYTQQAAEVGQVHMYNTMDSGWGYNFGVLAKLGGGFSAGATYRSRVEVVYDAEASFTQYSTGYADFDQVVAMQIPFDENVPGETRINFPAEIRLGLAWHGGAWGIETNVVRMGWDSFQELPIILEGYPLLSSVREEGYVDCYTYRLGVEYRSSPTWAWLFGALYDENPVPTDAVSPLLPDSNRTGISVGFAWDLSHNMRLDFGFLHLIFDERSTEGLDHDNFNGTYKQTAELLGLTVGYKF